MKKKIQTPRQKVFDMCAMYHSGQLRRITNEPYFNHAIAVATIAEPYHKLAYEIGLCHDLLEDPRCTIMGLANSLKAFGYSFGDVDTIVGCVIDLTDVYTTTAHPDKNRRTRKDMEAQRLYEVSPLAQTVKYADLIDNTKSILVNEPGFALRYLKEKEHLLKGMRKGEPVLLSECDNMVTEGLVIATKWHEDRAASKLAKVSP